MLNSVMLFAFIALANLDLLTCQSADIPYYGRYLGTLQNPGYALYGDVWVSSETKLTITDFTFQPPLLEPLGNNITFWIGPAKPTGLHVVDMFPSRNGLFVFPTIERPKVLLDPLVEASPKFIIAKRPTADQIRSIKLRGSASSEARGVASNTDQSDTPELSAPEPEPISGAVGSKLDEAETNDYLLNAIEQDSPKRPLIQHIGNGGIIPAGTPNPSGEFGITKASSSLFGGSSTISAVYNQNVVTVKPTTVLLMPTVHSLSAKHDPKEVVHIFKESSKPSKPFDNEVVHVFGQSELSKQYANESTKYISQLNQSKNSHSDLDHLSSQLDQPSANESPVVHVFSQSDQLKHKSETALPLPEPIADRHERSGALIGDVPLSQAIKIIQPEGQKITSNAVPRRNQPQFIKDAYQSSQSSYFIPESGQPVEAELSISQPIEEQQSRLSPAYSFSRIKRMEPPTIPLKLIRYGDLPRGESDESIKNPPYEPFYEKKSRIDSPLQPEFPTLQSVQITTTGTAIASTVTTAASSIAITTPAAISPPTFEGLSSVTNIHASNETGIPNGATTDATTTTSATTIVNTVANAAITAVLSASSNKNDLASIIDDGGEINPPSEPRFTPLYSYYRQNIVLHLPHDTEFIEHMSWLSVYDHVNQNELSTLIFPKSMPSLAPKRRILQGFRPILSKNVSSSAVIIEDMKTIRVKNFFFEGDAPGAWFVVSKSYIPGLNGQIIPIYIADGNYTCDFLEIYDGNSDVILKLPGSVSMRDIYSLSVYCIPYRISFAHIYIPFKDLMVPAASEDHNEVPFCQLES